MIRKHRLLLSLLAFAASVQAAATHATEEGGIAWREGDVDASFAAAKEQGKPVFLYWGAVWCPPCNQVKATIFNRQDFIERSRFFVPVYIDGDKPSAQKLGARFKVTGYPTMILFTPGGREITRLPGEVDAEQYMQVLTLGINGARPIKDTLTAALGSSKSQLRADDWRMLAYYSWVTDDQQLLPKEKVAPTLHRLATACPAELGGISARLELNAIATRAGEKNAKPKADAAAVAQLTKWLADGRFVRDNFDLFTNYASDIAGNVTLPKSAERAQLAATWGAAMEKLAADATLSTADRLTATTAQVMLVKLDAPKDPLPEPLQKRVREQVAAADKATTDVYARQAVINEAANLLTEANLMNESDALLTAELQRSHSPYYFMLDLAANAKKRGDKAAAVAWSEKAYAAAKGPATRLQWGVHYVSDLIELAPEDATRIEQAAHSVIAELEPVPDTFYDRNRRGLERMGKKLAGWNKDGSHSAEVKRINAQLSGVCGKLPAQDPARAACAKLTVAHAA